MNKTTIILDGRKEADKLLNNLAKKIKARKLKLVLAIVSVGQEKVTEIYLKQKQIACKKAGIGFKAYHLPSETSVRKLIEEIKKIAKNKRNSGMVVQLPLKFDYETTSEILDSIPCQKDPDCLSAVSFDKFCRGGRIMPPVISALAKFFKIYKIKIKNRNAVVVGEGRLVGLPASLWLEKNGANLVTVNKFTRNMPDFVEKADIVISGAGQANLIKGPMIKTGAVVIDVGASYKKAKVCGDVETKSVLQKAGFLALVPGGVGPLTIACLLENLVELNS